mmetsp:Transcript_23065/g.50757  ORF Transcript_23065/g.50757 Transcript_23065/m.50757 type:complete len:469 (+) Transcript_23065:310-1716(+)
MSGAPKRENTGPPPAHPSGKDGRYAEPNPADRLLERRHGGSQLLNIPIVLPGLGHGLPLGVELGAGLAIEVQVTADRGLIAREREHGQRHGDGEVDADLARVDHVHVLSCSRSRSGENGGAVAVLVGIHQLDSIVKRLHLHACQHRPKDLFVVDGHPWLHLADHGRAHEIPVLVTLRHRRVAAVQQDVSTLVSPGLDQPLHPVLGCLGDQRADVHTGLGAGSHAELGRRLGNLWDQLSGLADEHCDGQSHAPLAGRAAGCPSNSVDCTLGISVGENHSVVLRSHVALGALPISTSTSSDVLPGDVPAHKRDRLDMLIVAQEVHRVVGPVNHVHYPRGHPAVVGHLHKLHSGHRHPLRGLQQHRVPTGRGQGEHPQRDHGREVERGDACGDTQGQAVGVGVHIRADVGQGLALEHARGAAGMLNHLQAAEHVAAGVGEGLALLAGDHGGQGLGLLADGALELVHDARPD